MTAHSDAARPAERILAALVSLASVLSPVACQRPSPPPPSDRVELLFDSRIPLADAMQRLAATGGDVGKILRPHLAADLAVLEARKRYLFVVGTDGALAIAPAPEGAKEAYDHPTLVAGDAVRTAGGIRVERDPAGTLTKVVVDPGSASYCPTSESIRAAVEALQVLRVPPEVIRVDNRPVTCVGAPVAEGSKPTRASFGVVMLGVGRRFEVLGKAVRANRLDLASYEVEELEEVFGDEVPRTPPPPMPAGVTITPFLVSFRDTNIPALRKALGAKDAKAIAAAFESASQTCNACHRAAGKWFIEVPAVPGGDVPRLDALAQ